jgi:transcriptional regulator with XRE-family HTH domain
MNIAHALKMIRKRRDIKQKDACKEIGISQSYLSLIEKGQRQPSLDVLQGIAGYYNMPLPIILWHTITEEDVSPEKIEIYKRIKPTIDKLIDEIF